MATSKENGQNGKNGNMKKSIHRSPGYPMFGLDEAVDKIKILWDKDGKAGAPKEIAVKHLGYSSPAPRTISALKKFGLIEEKDGRIMVSQRGISIILYPNTDARHIRSLKDAALEPGIYRKLFDRYKDGLPSRETIKAELVGEFEFNPRRVDGFSNDFFSTLEYAGLEFGEEQKNEDMEDGLEDQPPEDSGEKKKETKSHATENRPNSFPVLLQNQNLATLSFERLPVSESDINLLKQWIDLFKDNLTASSEDPPS